MMEKERYKEKRKDEPKKQKTMEIQRCLKISAMTMDTRYFIQNPNPYALNKNQNQFFFINIESYSKIDLTNQGVNF
jgi:hypothetical protein